jgi:hypothetical protein
VAEDILPRPSKANVTRKRERCGKAQERRGGGCEEAGNESVGREFVGDPFGFGATATCWAGSGTTKLKTLSTFSAAR